MESFLFFADEEKSSSVGVVQKESKLETGGSQESEARVASGRDVEKERESVCSVDAKSSCSDSETQQGKDWIFSPINQNSFVPFFFASLADLYEHSFRDQVLCFRILSTTKI